MSELQDRVEAWHLARFPRASRWGVFAKLVEEVGEVAEAMNYTFERDEQSATARGSEILGELADVVIVSMALAARWTDGNLIAAVAEKLAKLEDPQSGHRAAIKHETIEGRCNADAMFGGICRLAPHDSDIAHDFAYPTKHARDAAQRYGHNPKVVDG